MKRITVLMLLVTGALFSSQPLAGQEKLLTIDECVEIALKQNSDILLGKITVKISGRDLVIALADFLPTISTYMGYSHSVLGPSSAVRIDPGTGIPIPLQPFEIKSWATGAGFSISQQILDGGYTISNVIRTRQLSKSAKYSFESTKQLTIQTVKERYYNLLAAEKLLGVAEETLKGSTESHKRAQVLFEVGKAPKSDVLNAKVQMETDRLSLLQAQNTLAIAQASLSYILGFPVDEVIKVVDNLEMPEMEIGYDDALQNAFSLHPDLKKADYDLKAAGAGIGMAIARYLPNFSAYFSYSWRNADFNEIDKFLDTDYNYYYQFSVSLPIFQGFERLANLSRADLTYKSYRESLEKAKRDVALEAQESFLYVDHAKKQIAVSRDAVDAALEYLRLNREKYNLGAGTMLDLINAQVSLARAKSDNIQALYTYKTSIARLQRAMGKLEK